MCSFHNAKLVVIEVNVPKEVRTYCPKCKQHQAHSVTLYKAGKARPMAAGARARARKERLWRAEVSASEGICENDQKADS
jgi:ribosomal protein L44E